MLEKAIRHKEDGSIADKIELTKDKLSLFKGKKYMVPNVKDFIKKIDINDNIYVSLIPGLIDDI